MENDIEPLFDCVNLDEIGKYGTFIKFKEIVHYDCRADNNRYYHTGDIVAINPPFEFITNNMTNEKYEKHDGLASLMNLTRVLMDQMKKELDQAVHDKFLKETEMLNRLKSEYRDEIKAKHRFNDYIKSHWEIMDKED